MTGIHIEIFYVIKPLLLAEHNFVSFIISPTLLYAIAIIIIIIGAERAQFV
jgi:hypothetical protein